MRDGRWTFLRRDDGYLALWSWREVDWRIHQPAQADFPRHQTRSGTVEAHSTTIELRRDTALLTLDPEQLRRVVDVAWAERGRPHWRRRPLGYRCAVARIRSAHLPENVQLHRPEIFNRTAVRTTGADFGGEHFVVAEHGAERDVDEGMDDNRESTRCRMPGSRRVQRLRPTGLQCARDRPTLPTPPDRADELEHPPLRPWVISGPSQLIAMSVELISSRFTGLGVAPMNGRSAGEPKMVRLWHRSNH